MTIKTDSDKAFVEDFTRWWDEQGQFCRAGGGEYERTFAFEAWRHLHPILTELRQVNNKLEADNDLLRGPKETVTVCEMGKPFSFMAQDPCRHSLCEVTYAKPVYKLIEERNQLREIVSSFESRLREIGDKIDLIARKADVLDDGSDGDDETALSMSAELRALLSDCVAQGEDDENH